MMAAQVWPAVGHYELKLARVLLVNNEVASRLTMQTLLSAAGYHVDVAATGAEALSLLDENEYELVLADPLLETPGSGNRILQYARSMDYRPAIALVRSYHESDELVAARDEHQVCVDTSDVEMLLDHVADLIGQRARRRAGRSLRHLAS